MRSVHPSGGSVAATAPGDGTFDVRAAQRYLSTRARGIDGDLVQVDGVWGRISATAFEKLLNGRLKARIPVRGTTAPGATNLFTTPLRHKLGIESFGGWTVEVSRRINDAIKAGRF